MNMSRKLQTLCAELGVDPPCIGQGQWACYVNWTEEHASNILAYRNPSNRPLTRHVSENYGKAMKEGRFPATGQTILFDKDANLMDGQNRLSGICFAKIAVPILTVFGVNREECFSFIDGGKRRGLADALFMANKATKNRSLLAGAIMSLYEFCHFGSILGRGRGTLAVTNQELLDFAAWFDDGLEQIASRMASGLRCPVVAAQGSVATALHAIFAKIDPKLAEEFFVGMAESSMLLGDDRWDGARKLVKRVSQRDTLGMVARGPYSAFLIKAWNCFVTNSGMDRLVWYNDKGEAFPQIEGVKYNKEGQLCDKRFSWPPSE